MKRFKDWTLDENEKYSKEARKLCDIAGSSKANMKAWVHCFCKTLNLTKHNTALYWKIQEDKHTIGDKKHIWYVAMVSGMQTIWYDTPMGDGAMGLFWRIKDAEEVVKVLNKVAPHYRAQVSTQIPQKIEAWQLFLFLDDDQREKALEFLSSKHKGELLGKDLNIHNR